jgi:hypothetical protein
MFEQGAPHYKVIKKIGKDQIKIDISNKLTLDEATTMAFNKNGYAAEGTMYSAAVMSLDEINKMNKNKLEAAK